MKNGKESTMTAKSTPVSNTEVLTDAEVLEYFNSLSNWGRWGEDDRTGTLNLITPAVRAAAGTLIDSGVPVSLSRTIDPADPDPLGSGLAVVQRFMGLNEVEHMKGEPHRVEGHTEYVGISAHGSNTHIDGLAHYSFDGKNYNGFAASETTALAGAKKLSMKDAEHGMVTRGVLLDIAALHDVDWLPASHPIMPEDLDAAAERQGVEVRPGDALLFHTGNVARILANGPDPADMQPGLHARCLPWLRAHDISVLGSDAIQDVQPSGLESFDLFRPIHTVGLVALGLWLIDNMELTELAAKCREFDRWEFFFAALPWRFAGVTSSASNPVAVF